MEAKPKRLAGAQLTDFLRSLGIVRVEPVGRSSASGEAADENQLTELLERGDPLPPGPGPVAEDPETLERLFGEADPDSCFGLTPDGHLSNQQPLRFDPVVATEQVIQLVEADMPGEDRDEALAATWLGLAYHDRDHASDFGGLVRDASSAGRPKSCYLDVKGTKAVAPAGQRTKLEQRAQERKFGCMAQTVTVAARGGFLGYPGHGKPGLLVTLLHNPVQAGKSHAGYAVNWFFGIRSNYQAAAAAWGWGGPLGVKLPQELLQLLSQLTTTIGGQTKSGLDLLREYRDYSQYKNTQGEWDRETLRATLQAKALAARYLLMNENPVTHAETTTEELAPKNVSVPLRMEDFHPGESFASYYGRKADAAIAQQRQAEEKAAERVRQAEEKAAERVRQAEEKAAERVRQAEEKAAERVRQAEEKAAERICQAEEKARQADEHDRQRTLALRPLVARQRQQGCTDQELANEMGYSLEEFLERFPHSS